MAAVFSAVLIFSLACVTIFAEDAQIDQRGQHLYHPSRSLFKSQKTPKIIRNLKETFTPSKDLNLGNYHTCANSADVISLAGSSRFRPIIFQSPNFPFHYPDNVRCSANFSVPSNAEIKIYFIYSHLECPYDSIDIQFSLDETTLYNICPHHGISFVFTPIFVGYKFQLIFSSDSSVTYTGFQALLYIKNAPITTSTSRPTTSTTIRTTFTTSSTSNTTTTTSNTSTTTTTTANTSNATTTTANTSNTTTTTTANTSNTTTTTANTSNTTTTTTTASNFNSTISTEARPTSTTPSVSTSSYTSTTLNNSASTSITLSTTLSTSPSTATQSHTTPSTTEQSHTTSSNTRQCTCGKWEPGEDHHRIVGGFVAAPHSIPYQVGLVTSRGSQPFCGGTLISPKYVLTAAHCTVQRTTDDTRVVVNDVNFGVLGDGEIFINLENILIHPNYNGPTQDFDFSILKLATLAPINNTVNLACLPPVPDEQFVGTNMTISGWGTTSSGGFLSPALKAGFVTGMSNTECSQYYHITRNMICATTPLVDTDTCQGDSGGPMVANISGTVTLVGLTSFGRGCAEAPYPGVYSRVSAQIEWIYDHTDARNCQH